MPISLNEIQENVHATKQGKRKRKKEKLWPLHLKRTYQSKIKFHVNKQLCVQKKLIIIHDYSPAETDIKSTRLKPKSTVHTSPNGL